MEASADSDRIATLHLQLIDEIDPLRRAGVHLELATLSLGAGQFESAARHFREALVLDTTLERARAGLRSLGAVKSGTKGQQKGVRGWWARLRNKG